MRNAGAWLWLLIAALLVAVAVPLTVYAADGGTSAPKKPKPDAGS
jgi:hypothetical protein